MEDKYRMRQQTVMQETAQFYLRWGWASQASDRAAGPRALCLELHPSTAPSLLLCTPSGPSHSHWAKLFAPGVLQLQSISPGRH